MLLSKTSKSVRVDRWGREDGEKEGVVGNLLDDVEQEDELLGSQGRHHDCSAITLVGDGACCSATKTGSSSKWWRIGGTQLWEHKVYITRIFQSTAQKHRRRQGRHTPAPSLLPCPLHSPSSTSAADLAQPRVRLGVGGYLRARLEGKDWGKWGKD